LAIDIKPNAGVGPNRNFHVRNLRVACHGIDASFVKNDSPPANKAGTTGQRTPVRVG